MYTATFVLKQRTTEMLRYLAYAEVKAEVTTKNLLDENNFMDALIKGITERINTTPEGKKAWEDSCEDFNIGDLSLLNEDDSFEPIPERVGIKSLSISVTSFDNVAKDYDFDSLLYDENLL